MPDAWDDQLIVSGQNVEPKQSMASAQLIEAEQNKAPSVTGLNMLYAQMVCVCVCVCVCVRVCVRTHTCVSVFGLA